MSLSFLCQGGFNPCFSGYGIQTIGIRKQPAYSLKFQSLFFWIWNSDWISRLLCCGFFWVSILVFLDMEFRPVSGATGAELDKCFNPCFSGYGIQTGKWNIFCCWFLGFQSLFFWIWNSDNAIDSAALREWFCFNPCFSGYGIQTFI